MAGTCERALELSFSINCGEYLERLRSCSVFKDTSSSEVVYLFPVPGIYEKPRAVLMKVVATYAYRRFKLPAGPLLREMDTAECCSFFP